MEVNISVKTNAAELAGKKGALFKLTVATFASLLMNILVQNVDQLMISRYSQAGVAAVGNAGQLWWILTLFFVVMSSALVILVTQYKGAGDTEREHTVYVLSIAFNSVLGVILGAVCLLFGRQIFALMNVTDPEIAEYAYQYIAITGGAVILNALVLTYDAIFRANAMMRELMVINIGMNLVNIVGNWMLIYGVGPFPELGVRGVAIATVVSRLLCVVTMAVYGRRKLGGLRWGLLRKFPFGILKKLLAIGIPTAGENFSYDLSQLVIMSFVNTMGLVAVNTRIYLTSVTMFAYMLTEALAEATQVFEGYMLGAKRHDDAQKLITRTVRIGIVCSLVMTVVLYFFSDSVLSVFIGADVDPALRAGILTLGKKVMTVEILLELGRAVNLVVVRSLQTAGDIRFPVVIGIISQWSLAVGCGWLLSVPVGLGLVGIWLGMALDECIRGAVLSARWKKGGWRKIDLVS